MTENTETVSRIPLARSVVYTVRGVPEIDDGYSGEHTIAPTEISLTYRLAADGQPGSVHAYVAGWWMRGAVRVPMDKPVGRHFPGRTFADWPAWLAEEARLHDPAAVVVRVPDTSQTTDRDRIAEALRYWVHPTDRGTAADAVLAALPAPSDRAAVDAVRKLHQPMERGPFTICAHCSGWDGKWRCLGVVANYPCPTLRAMAERQAADAEHVGGGANAEDCPACSGTNPPYPFLCPGPAVSGRTDNETRGCGCPSEDVSEHMFGSDSCTCIPFIRQDGETRYCGPTDTVDMIAGWEIGRDCPHHQPAVGGAQPKETGA
jgi:hypothetical protein